MLEFLLISALLGGSGILIRNWMKNQEAKNKEQDYALETMKDNYISRFDDVRRQISEVEIKLIKHFSDLMLAIEKVNASVSVQNQICQTIQNQKSLDKKLAN